MKLAIGLPTDGLVKSETVEGLVMAAQHFDSKVIIETSSSVLYNRNKIVEIAKKEGCTHLLFVDSDMRFNHLDIDQLLRADKDIISGIYNLRKHPLITIVRMKEGDEIVIPKELPKELFKCHSTGAGCLLIKMEVFEKLKKPYFAFKTIEGQNVVMGEDNYFCDKAREAGYDVWVDPTVMIGHIGSYVY
jgi:GT2 family glycosyltransferase